VATLQQAAAILERRNPELPVNLAVQATADHLRIAAASIEMDGAQRGGQVNPVLQSLIMGLATTFHRHGEPIRIAENSRADQALQDLLPTATGRVANWETRREYLRKARTFQRSLPSL
jgi:hypothetical protein